MLLIRTLLATVLSIAAHEVHGQQWSEIKIPRDSLQPLALKFADSLTGYFHGIVPFLHDDGFTFYTRGRHYWYRTLDGGKNWLPIDFDTLYNNEYYDFNGKRYYHGFGPPFTNPDVDQIACYGNMVTIRPGSRTTNLRSVLLVSTDRGATWKEQATEPDILDFLKFSDAFASNYLVGYSGYSPLRSLDGGKTFIPCMGGEVFLNSTTDTLDNGNTYRLSINLTCSSPDRWTAIVIPTQGNDTLKKKKEEGLITLITEDGGDHWTYHKYFLPSDSSLWLRGVLEGNGSLRSIRGTSSMYFPTQQLCTRWTSYSPFSPVFLLSEYYSGARFRNDAEQVTSYLYSSDYGATWQPETTYHKRRVAFSAPAPGNVWMTLWRNELPKGSFVAAPGMFADIIAHTTDFGKTWTLDSTTLHPLEFTPRDGNIICFTDPRHGWIAASNQFGTSIFRYIHQASSADEFPEYGYFYQLFPNPADQEFTAKLAPFMKLRKIEIYDLLGRKYQCSYTLKENNSAVIDCSQLHPGHYLVSMIAQQGSRMKSITKAFGVQR